MLAPPDSAPGVAAGSCHRTYFLQPVSLGTSPSSARCSSGVSRWAALQGFVINLIVAALVSGLLAALTYRFVEAPFIRRKSPSK